jgi:uncharacterized repeat protein (TIGR03803 family)
MKNACLSFLLIFLLAFSATAQTFSTLLNFDGANGASPYNEVLTQGLDGNLYGTTEIGGNAHACLREGCGTIFQLTRAGAVSNINFDNTNGAIPESGVLLAADGNFYGTTGGGGSYGYGTIYKVTRNGKFSTFYTFCSQPNCADGASPFASLTEGADGDFYGSTSSGGTPGGGVIFKITADGLLTVLHNFCSLDHCADGSDLYSTLIQGADGNFYGTTSYGGKSGRCPGGCGTVFRISPGGKFQTLYRFDLSDGAVPFGALTLGDDGNFYGVTIAGGDLSCMPPYGCGTIFRITPTGATTILHTFEKNEAGGAGALVLATDGNFYGETCGVINGKVVNNGTLFRMTPDGTVTTLHSFSPPEGRDPTGGMLQATDGVLYGTTIYGGEFTCRSRGGCGTTFTLDVGLGPFVTFVRGYGNVGQGAVILGQGLIGTAGVTFNGVPASFHVISDTYLIAAVPPGATTGYVTVTTPTGMLTSNKKFVVLP